VAIVVVQNLAPGGSSTANGQTVSYTPGTAFTVGNTILAVLQFYSLTGSMAASGANAGFKVNGVAGTRDFVYLDGSAHQGLEFWRCTNIASAGDALVSWTGNGAPDGNYVLRGFIEVSGLDNSSPVDQTPTRTTGGSTAPSITSGTTTTANELVLVGFLNEGTSDPTITAPSGYTPIASDGGWSAGASGGSAYKIIAATGAQTAAFTLGTSTGWAMAMVTYKAATGGGPAIPPNRRALLGVGI